MKKLGVFGGTFDPPHNGHYNAAIEFISKLELDELLVIPTFVPPHKDRKSDTTAEERLEMTRLAFSNIPNVIVSDIEIKRGGKSYTYLTLEELTNSDTELYFLCGTDMFLTLDKWKNPEIIFNLATICCVRRETDTKNIIELQKKFDEYKIKYNSKVIFIQSKVIEVST